MTSLLIISNDQCIENIGMDEAILAVESAFRENVHGAYNTFPVVREFLKDGIFGIKSGARTTSEGMIGLKAGGYWGNNPRQFQLAAHQSTIMLFDSATGVPKAVIGANYLTGLRTGAAGAVAAKYLARPNSRQVALFGSGIQSEMQIRALVEVLPVERVAVYSPVEESLHDFQSRTADIENVQFDFYSNHGDMKTPTLDADLIITTTPSYEFVVPKSWVSAGVHINAIGADTRGKQELDPAIFQHALAVADSFEQCVLLGDLQHPVAAGILDRTRVRELSEVIEHPELGRTNAEQITVFDATGVYLEDLAVGEFVYQKALSMGFGITASI